MAIQITREILEALQKAVDNAGSLREFSNRSGITTASASRYLNRITTTLNQGSWIQLEPHIKPWLPKDFKAPVPQPAPRSTDSSAQKTQQLTPIEQAVIEQLRKMPQTRIVKLLLEITEEMERKYDAQRQGKDKNVGEPAADPYEKVAEDQAGYAAKKEK